LDYLPLGTDLIATDEYLLQLPDNKTRQAYLIKRMSELNIIINTLAFYVETADPEYLSGSSHQFIKSFLERENILIESIQNEIEGLYLIQHLNERLLCFAHNLLELMEKYDCFSEINFEPSAGNIDNRIPFNGPEAVLIRCFERLAEMKYTRSLKREEIMLHFRCTDTTIPFDRKSIAHSIIWNESAYKFVVLWNKLVDAGFIRGNQHIKYTQIGSHIVNNRNEPFKKPSRSYNNVKNSLSEYRDIELLVEELVKFAFTL